MSIIYSYPEQGQLNADDMLIGTSAEKVGGKQKNITRNFTVQQIADFINQGTGFVDPVASDFQIPVFNQEGKKITGSIMSQNIYPNGSAITIAGSLTVNNDLTASGNILLGSGSNSIVLQSPTTLGGPIKDSSNTLGVSNQILISNGLGNLVWQNYEAGLTYEGTWNASTNTPTLTSGQGVSGHFYIVNVAGNTNLDGNNDWRVGDWAVFFDAGGAGTAGWQKIDNTSVLTGSGTANTFAMWTATETLNDSLLSQDAGATKVIVDGLLEIKGDGTSQDGRIKLNCWNNNHGVTIQSPPHSAAQSWTWILPQTTGGANQVLTTDGGTPSQLSWTDGETNISIAGSGNTDVSTVKGLAGFSSDDFTVSSNGWVEAKDFNGSTPGYVPDATSATAGTFLKEDGTWSAIAPPTGIGSYTTGNGTILIPQTTSTQLAISDILASGSVYTFLSGLSLGDLVQITDGTVNGFFTFTIAGSGPNAWRFAYVSGEIPTNFSTATNAINLRNAAAGVIGNVTGTGTQNYVTKWSSGGTGIEDSTIFDTGTNVGIGTASPDTSTKLSVSTPQLGAASGTGITLSGWNGTSQSKVQLMSYGIDDGTFAIRSGSSNTEKMRIDSDGNVGIGTSSPNSYYAGANNLVIEKADGAGLTIASNATSDGSIYFADGITGAQAYAGYLEYNHSSDFFRVGVNGTEKMRITSGGNVGIGTSSPGAKLEVAGSVGSFKTTGHQIFLTRNGNNEIYTVGASSVLALGTNSTESMRIDSSGRVLMGVTDGAGSIKLTVGDGTNPRMEITPVTNAIALEVLNDERSLSKPLKIYAEETVFHSRNHPSGYAEAMRVDSNGNVGIGAASPAVSLDISATDAVQMPVGLTGDRPAGANGMLRYNSTNNGFEGYINGNWGDIGGGSSGGLIFRGTFDASNGSITGGGNLYTCPTGGPGGTVDIAVGDLYIVTTAGSFYCSGTSLNIGDEVICITAATAGNSSVTDWNAVASGAGGAVTGSGTTNYVPKFTGATVVGNSSIFNDASGNVGIGTTSPVEKLYVNSTSGDARIGLNAPTGSDTEIKFSNAGVVQYSIGHDDATDNFVIGTANVDTPKVSITSAGNVGIGTTSPGAKLDVSGNGKFTIQSGAINNTAPDAVTLSNVTTAAHAAGLGASLKFDFTNSTSSYAGSVISSESNADPNTSDLVFKPRNYGNAEAMRIDSSGNVGIGTTAPNAKLHIKETTASTSQIKMSAASNEANYGYLTMTDNTINTAKLTLGTTFGYNVEVPAITIFNGEVCIGTTNPTEKLQVDGNIRAVTSGETKIKIRGSGDSSDLNLVSQNQTFFVKRGASERMTIDSSGNVGIGTSSPGARLEVVEASPTNGIVADFVNSTNAGGTTAAIKLSNTTLDSCDVILGANRVGANFGSDFFISLSDSVDGTIQERFRITEAGKVGIGTDQPEVSLYISATDAILVPTGTTNDRPSGILPGMIRYNTSTNEFEGYSGTLNVSGSWGALGGSSGAPTITKDLFQVTTAQSIFNLTAGVNPQDANYVNIFIDGVYQNSGTYTVATATGTTTVNLNTAAPVGTSVEIISTT